MTTNRPDLDTAHWEARFAELVEKHGIPGAQLGILRLGADGADDEVFTTATGVLHAGTGQVATPDSVFQIGSVSKVWTATVVMQLVDEGLFDARHPGGRDPPRARARDTEVTKKVTVWHLLTHTSGIDGDVFTDTGRGDDAWRSTSPSSASGAEPPHRRDLVLLQLRLLGRSAGSSRSSPARPGTGDAGAALHARSA